MPIYEYRCECGATLEALESVGAVRERCGDLCVRQPAADLQGPAGLPGPGVGAVERVLSAPGIRGDGKEAREAVFNPVARAKRPGCDCETDG